MAFSTPSSNPFGSFGASTSTAPAAGGTNIFGGASTSAAPSTSTNIFGGTSTAGGGGGAFGSTSAAPASGAGGLFGSTAGAGQQASGAGGAFGQSTSTSQPSGGLFGASTAQAAPSTGAGLFGSSAAAPVASNPFGQTTTPQGGAGGLFGSKPAASAGGLFGSGTTGTGTGASGGLFGSTGAGTGSGGAFGAFGSSTAGGNAFGSSGAFGRQQQQPQNNLLGQSASAPGQQGLTLLKTTRFNDLPADSKHFIEQLDAYIQEETAIGEELKAREFGTAISEGKTRLRDVSTDFTSLSAQISTTTSSLSSLRASLDSLTRSFLRASSLIDAHRSNPSTTSLTSNSNPLASTQGQGNEREVLLQKAQRAARFPFEYFEEKVREMEGRLERCQLGMEGVAGMVRGWSDRGNPAAIVPALRAQHSTFMSLASSVASLDVQLKALKEDYRELWRRQMGGSLRDPFEEEFLERTGIDNGVGGDADLEEEGLEGDAVRVLHCTAKH